MKGAIGGAAVGAGAGHLAGKSLTYARRMSKIKAPRKATAKLVKSHVANQKFVIGEIRQYGTRRGLAAFPEIKNYVVSSNVKMTTERAMRHYGGEKGLNPAKMVQEVLSDVYAQTYKSLKTKDSKRARQFKKAWMQRQFGGREDMTFEGFIQTRAAKRFGFSKKAEAQFTDSIIKYAAGKYEDLTYKSNLQSVSGKERIMRGIRSSGLPSAVLTGALGLAAGTGYKPAMRAAIGVGLLGTTIGTIATPTKERVFVPTND